MATNIQESGIKCITIYEDNSLGIEKAGIVWLQICVWRTNTEVV